MLSLKKPKSRPTVDPTAPPRAIQFATTEGLWSTLGKVARKWRCSPEIAARRLVVMSLTGWKLRFAGELADLSKFAGRSEDPFQCTCTILRAWINSWTEATGETLTDDDLDARLLMLLDNLQEEKNDGGPASLSAMVAADDGEDDGR